MPTTFTCLPQYRENITNHQELENGNDTQEQQVAHEIGVDIRLINEQKEFIGLGSVSLNGRLQPKKLIQL